MHGSYNIFDYFLCKYTKSNGGIPMKQCYRNPIATEWYRNMAKNPADFPFLFTYGGTDYEGFGALTLVSRESKRKA